MWVAASTVEQSFGAVVGGRSGGVRVGVAGGSDLSVGHRCDEQQEHQYRRWAGRRDERNRSTHTYLLVTSKSEQGHWPDSGHVRDANNVAQTSGGVHLLRFVLPEPETLEDRHSGLRSGVFYYLFQLL